MNWSQSTAPSTFESKCTFTSRYRFIFDSIDIFESAHITKILFNSSRRAFDSQFDNTKRLLRKLFRYTRGRHFELQLVAHANILSNKTAFSFDNSILDCHRSFENNPRPLSFLKFRDWKSAHFDDVICEKSSMCLNGNCLYTHDSSIRSRYRTRPLIAV